VQRRLVTLATCTGGGFRGRGAGGWPCQNHPTVRPRAYVYRWSRRGALYVQRCTIEPPSSWQDARRKTPNDLLLASLPLSLSLSLCSSPLCLPISFRPLSRPAPFLCLPRSAETSSPACRLFYFPPCPLSAHASKPTATARCSETLQLLAAGLASYADSRGASCAETAANLRQFAFGIASRKSLSLLRTAR